MSRRFHLERTLPVPKITTDFLRTLEDQIKREMSSRTNEALEVTLAVVDAEGTEEFDSAFDELLDIRLQKSTAVIFSFESSDEEQKVTLHGSVGGLNVELATMGARAREDALRLLGQISELCQRNSEGLRGVKPGMFSVGHLPLPSLRLTPEVAECIKDLLVEKIATFTGASAGLVEVLVKLEEEAGRTTRTSSIEELKARKFPDKIHKLVIEANHEDLQRKAEATAELTAARDDTHVTVSACGLGAESFASDTYDSLMRCLEQHRTLIGIFHPSNNVKLALVFAAFVSIFPYDEFGKEVWVAGAIRSGWAILACYTVVCFTLPYTLFDNLKTSRRIHGVKVLGGAALTTMLGLALKPAIQALFNF